MNRLATRLLIAMLLVALVSLVVVPVAQMLAVRQAFANLNPDFLARVEPPTRPQSPFQGGRRFERRAPPFPVSDQQFLLEENTRLLNLLSDYRSAQDRAILFGTAGAILLAVTSAVWLSRSIAKPIEAVSQAASSLARGNLAARVDLQALERRSDETRRLARNFNAMADALERYEGERKAMIADIAHELRNPLATLQMRLEALRDGLVNFDDEEAKLLQGQVGLLARLVNDLRLLSLADAGRLSLNLTAVDLRELVEEVLSHALRRSEDAEITLLFTPPGEPVVAHADRDRLTQVLNNLLDNAFRVTPPGGRVEVDLRVLQDKALLRVRDTGPGLSEDELGAIFERFVQGRRRDTNSKTGSGLGLAIVQALVTLHGGQVQAANHARGAQFEVLLPRAENKARTSLPLQAKTGASGH